MAYSLASPIFTAATYGEPEAFGKRARAADVLDARDRAGRVEI